MIKLVIIEFLGSNVYWIYTLHRFTWFSLISHNLLYRCRNRAVASFRWTSCDSLIFSSVSTGLYDVPFYVLVMESVPFLLVICEDTKKL